jgi:predicted N-acetyltransferase YhbS
VAYERYYTAQLATAWGGQRLRRFALVDGTQVLSSAKLYTFDATLDHTPIRVVGLGAVFTQPAQRRRGAAAELIERLMARAAEDGADLALLFSEIGADYYARLGFETIPLSLSTLRVRESDRFGAPATLVRGADDRDLPAIVAMNESRARGFRFHLDRDRDLVQYAVAKKRLMAGLGSPGARETRFVAAEEGATAVAYALVSVRRNDGASTWVLEECGDRDPSGARVGAILQTLIARDPAEARPTLTTWLPHGFCPPQVTVAESRPSSDVMMARPLSARARAALPLGGEDVLFWKADHF